jgi:hypothetical protein
VSLKRDFPFDAETPAPHKKKSELGFVGRFTENWITARGIPVVLGVKGGGDERAT